jgi:tetratricopeptide (TPR) repeat protein
MPRTTPEQRRALVTTPRDGFLTTSPRGEASGAGILRELAGRPVGLGIWRAFRLLTLWMTEPPQGRPGLLDDAGVDAALVAAAGDLPFDPEDVRGALVFILGEITSVEPDLKRTARACLAVADWALADGAEETALAYARAAALVGANARYAWLAGRLHREHNRALQAEVWFQVAYSLADREHDWDIRARSLSSLGHLHLNAGNYPRARRLFQRALGIAVHYKLEQRTCEAHHYLFTVARAVSDHDSATKHSRAAALVYGPEHPRLPYFAHDLACYWMDRGDYHHALEVLVPLLREHFREMPAERLLATGSALRAAGGSGQASTFDDLLASFGSLRELSAGSPWYAQALHAAARGAAGLWRWALAEDFLLAAMQSAKETGQHDTEYVANELLSEVRQQRHGERAAFPDPANATAAFATVKALVSSSLAVG